MLSVAAAEAIAWQIVGDSAVLVNVASGTSVALNGTGTFIWQRLASESENEIARAMADEFGVPVEQALCDVNEFVELLREKSFVK